eukprot:6206712-Pleurochrysis_carterae.AAC.1
MTLPARLNRGFTSKHHVSKYQMQTLALKTCLEKYVLPTLQVSSDASNTAQSYHFAACSQAAITSPRTYVYGNNVANPVPLEV